MLCLYCQSTNIKKNGKTKLGFQQYRCKDCGKHYSDNPKGVGRPCKSDRAMTPAERAREYRKRKRLS